MIDQKTCEHIVQNAASVEAAIVISESGLPLAWHSVKGAPVDEVSSICAGLLAVARELHLFDTTSNASMVFETQFGALAVKTVNDESLLVLCLTEGYSLLTINSLLQKLSLYEPSIHH